MNKVVPPPRPPAYEERLAHRLFLALAPSRQARQPEPPSRREPYERLRIPRTVGSGELTAHWFRGPAKPRGMVVLAHPWRPRGQAFFFRCGRLDALRDAGYDALTFDFGGFGRSGPEPPGFFDVDVEAALRTLSTPPLGPRSTGLPVHLWGVSAGGYWAHVLLSRFPGVCGAFFEDVSLHLIEWSKRLAPRGLPFYLFFQWGFRRAYRFLDLRRHAASLCVRRVAYAGGGRDRGVPAAETRELARRAGGACRIVPGADHLEALRQDGAAVIALALETFERAEMT